eukprot:TRINITY_DN7142_c0_g1_i1.p1 TRINITY_DN7142_c0_g1~~TRINITY_DN7142_c0_g1_i1.p1  ORF type:complete len:149 (+),score=23.27 TRINITY_DN7142_c0_g1_i1:80-526(+)
MGNISGSVWINNSSSWNLEPSNAEDTHGKWTKYPPAIEAKGKNGYAIQKKDDAAYGAEETVVYNVTQPDGSNAGTITFHMVLPYSNASGSDIFTITNSTSGAVSIQYWGKADSSRWDREKYTFLTEPFGEQGDFPADANPLMIYVEIK